MLFRILLIAAGCALAARAQTVCAPTPTFSPCDIVYELNDQEAAAHTNPYATVQLEAEFRSPRFRTLRVAAFWDGGRRMVFRFAPTEPGEWVYKLSGNLQRLQDAEGKMTATESNSAGFLKPANVHHWALVIENTRKPHLWMGDNAYTFATIDRGIFDKLIDARAGQKFNHIRGVILPRDVTRAFPEPDRPDPAYFRELDTRIAAMNRKGIIADLILAWGGNQLTKLFPSREQRERYLRYAVARYTAMDVTWQGVQDFESYETGRALLKEIGDVLKTADAYQHPRSTDAAFTSSPLSGDGWMNYTLYGSPDDNLGAIEHQLYATPFVNADFGRENTGGVRAGADGVDTDEFRHRLWNAAMDGQSPTFANARTCGLGAAEVDAAHLDSPGARQMSVWFDFFSRTRYWELEPYFDVDGGRALALELPREYDEGMEGIEYIVYVEKPGPLEVLVQKHGYDVAWFNPLTGEYLKQKKGFKGDRFTGEPPDKTHDWVLHISREGRKEGLRSYKFAAGRIIMQEVEQNPTRAPFEIVEPAGDTISISKPAQYAIKLTRETRATRSMMYLWMGEVTGEEQGSRMIGTGAKGTFHIPPRAGRTYPASLAVRLYGMNANGKVYSLVRVWKIVE